MTENSEDNVITVTFINLKGLVVRRSTIPYGDSIPSLVVHWPYAASSVDIMALGPHPRWFTVNPASMLAGVRNIGQGLEYHEVDPIHVADMSKFKDVTSGT